MASNSLASVCFSMRGSSRVSGGALCLAILISAFSPSASASFIAGIARALEHVPGQKLAKTAGQQATHSADQVAGAAAHAGAAPGPSDAKSPSIVRPDDHARIEQIMKGPPAPKFDREAYHRNYMKEYMRKRRQKEKRE